MQAQGLGTTEPFTKNPEGFRLIISARYVGTVHQNRYPTASWAGVRPCDRPVRTGKGAQNSYLKTCRWIVLRVTTRLCACTLATSGSP